MKYSGDSKTAVVADIIRNLYPGPVSDLLVVGCGSGIEAAILAQLFDCNVRGIDIEDRFDGEARKHVQLAVGNAMALDFGDSTFDFVYSYHALEHIEDPNVALDEMKRVLKSGGGYCVGTPNRNRLLGYLGSKTASLSQKIRWNINDWKARLRGRFRNEFGAHAGFTPNELGQMLSLTFGNRINISQRYYEDLYPSGRLLIRILETSGMSRFAYPSVYFVGHKE